MNACDVRGDIFHLESERSLSASFSQPFTFENGRVQMRHERPLSGSPEQILIEFSRTSAQPEAGVDPQEGGPFRRYGPNILIRLGLEDLWRPGSNILVWRIFCDRALKKNVLTFSLLILLLLFSSKPSFI